MFFKLAMYWRILYGAMRICGGVWLWHMIGKPVTELLPYILHEDPAFSSGRPVSHFLHSLLSEHGLHITYFVAIYLIFWGVVDIFISIALLLQQIWAFPVSMIVIIGFLIYAIFRLAHTHSLMLFGIICLDTFILSLIYKEYKNLIKDMPWFKEHHSFHFH